MDLLQRVQQLPLLRRQGWRLGCRAFRDLECFGCLVLFPGSRMTSGSLGFIRIPRICLLSTLQFPKYVDPESAQFRLLDLFVRGTFLYGKQILLDPKTLRPKNADPNQPKPEPLHPKH